MDNFYKNTIQKDPRFHSINPVSDLALLEPVTRAAVQGIIVDAKAAGHNMMVFETYRSQELQAIYFRRGVTQLKTVGVHHYGLAADIVKVDEYGHPSWDGDFSFLGVLAKKHGLISGLDWGHPEREHSFIDPCHVQRVRVEDQGRLFSGDWYPDKSYDPYKGA